MKKNAALLLVLIIVILAAVLAIKVGSEGGEPDEPDGVEVSETDKQTVVESAEQAVLSENEQTTGQDGLTDYSRNGGQPAAGRKTLIINESGNTVRERILTPEGFERVSQPEGSFGEYLRNLPLKPHGSKVTYYNGDIKPWDVHAAVLDLDVGSRDLQQCADSVIRLRAEYLYLKGFYDKIHFNFTNGFNAEYSKWIAGYRIDVSGNKAGWVKQGSGGIDYTDFRKYLDMVFAYAGTLSLSKEMDNISVDEMQVGDVFLKGDSPGHCVIVLDMAKNTETGEMIFIAAQGYMPAQEMHIIKNPADPQENPWYPQKFGEELITPEWTFTKEQLYRFMD